MNTSKQFVLDRMNKGILAKTFKNDETIRDTEITVYGFLDAIKMTPNISDSVYDALAKNNEITIDLKYGCGERTCKVKYCPDVEYEYCATESSKHDGAILFIFENITKLLTRIFTGNTYNRETMPNDYEQNLVNYDLELEVGDVIVHSDYGMMHINDMFIAGQNDMACLPIRIKYISKDVAA